MAETPIKELEAFHRRISNFETTHLDREVKELEDLVREIAQKERSATSNFIEERNKNEINNRQNREFTHEVDKLRKELAQKNKLLAEFKSEQMARKLTSDQKSPESKEILELKKKVGELQHRLQTRTDENHRLTTQLEQYKKQCEAYKTKCIEMESGRHGFSETNMMGSLQTTVEAQNALSKQLTTELELCRQRCTTLETALHSSMEELEEFRASSKNLSKELEEQGHSMDEVHKILGNEISLVKQQKAKLRCEFLKCKSDLVAAERDLHDLQREHGECTQRIANFEKDLEIEKKLRHAAIADRDEAKRTEKELKEKLEKVEAEFKGEAAKLGAIVAKAEDQTTKLKEFVKQQDKQCDELANQVQFLADELETYKKKCHDKTNEIAELRRKATNADIQQVEVQRLKEELGRAKDKVIFMEREIKTLHVDYRGELADLTKKLALAQKENIGPSARKPVEEKLNMFIENQKKQLEQELATERKLLKEKTIELENLKREKEASSMEGDLKRKTVEAANALNECIIKLQARNEELSQMKTEKAEKEKELERVYSQLEDREEDIHELRQRLSKLEETMLYWKAMYERRMNPAHSESDDASCYTQDIMETKENHPEVHHAEEEEKQPMRYGMMRHEIAHRFKRVWMAMQKKSYECARCRENLPGVSTAMKCRDCNVYVHLSCARRMGKTCGLPADYAQLYVDAVTEQKVFADQGSINRYHDDRMDTL
ncbi:unnamed protein product [Bursaphelenchus xylophilus]|uniref:(pine wood nematode) hypothetical protein n=1 Tax=Bursaphelenchus xylophilus TaxID=6326 RepID=A0A1I7RJX2_BURXY|nr:unnamed protein product [Bursaphelenchus xylophilus]CAG9129129.1 unnamed protein product [Bursaphelenchus xylophilus]